MMRVDPCAFRRSVRDLFGFLFLLECFALSPALAFQDPVRAPTQERATEPVPVPQADQATIRHYRSGMIAWGSRMVLALAVPLAVMALGILPAVKRRLAGLHWSVQASALASVYAAMALAAVFPIAFYDEYVRGRAAGLTSRTIPSWALEWAIRAGLTFAFIAVVAPLGYLLIRKLPRSWWLWGGLSGGALGILIGVVFPVWIAPLLNRFEPMPDSALRTDILDVAARAGVDSPSLFVVEMRGKTEMVNAYVAGFGGTRRIVFWDTLLDALNPAELRFVAAHELAHDVLHHRWRLVVVGTVLLVLSLAIVHLAAVAILRRMRPATAADLRDPADLPVLVLASTLVGFVISPIALATNRSIEREADRFALELTRDNHAAATTWLTLQGHNLTHPDPGPIYRLFRATHPPLADRVQFADRYRPWERGEPMVYGDYLRE